jgi:hypothetical protein
MCPFCLVLPVMTILRKIRQAGIRRRKSVAGADSAARDCMHACCCITLLRRPSPALPQQRRQRRLHSRRPTLPAGTDMAPAVDLVISLLQ